jgi:ABC-2 type transport system ATP-binding protein
VVWDGAAPRLEAETPGSVYLISTSDDEEALALARGHDGVRLRDERDERGFRLVARPDALDAYTVALGRDGVGVRRLELLVSPLESMFFELTEAP